jgi:CubicO group peptidase (beta-lactamase class C family)
MSTTATTAQVQLQSIPHRRGCLFYVGRGLLALLPVVLVVLEFAVVVLPAASAQSNTPDFAALDTYIEAQMRAMNLPGLALGVVRGDQVVYLMGYGVADPSGQSVTSQTPFRLASLSKTLTAIAIMQLVEAGQVELDMPVQRYLPWFRLADAEASSLISVRDLLYHTSGIPPTAGYDNFYNGDQSDTALEQNVRQLAGIASNRPVGSTYQYANQNYDVLGLLVQTVSGETYEAYIQDHIFTPLAMHQSFTSQAEALNHGMAAGYRRWFGFPIPAELPDDRATRPSSFLISSAEDLTHLLIAELNGGQYGNTMLLSPQGIAETQRPVVAIGDTGWHSGMGLDIGELDGMDVAAKTGGTANYYARIVLVPDSDWGLVVLANTFDIGLGDQFDTIANGISTWLVNGQQLAVVQGPIGGGNAVMKFTLSAIVVFLIVTAFRTRVVLPPNPHDSRWLMRRIALPLALDLALAVILLVAVPRFINTPLNFLFYFAPDILWLVVAVVIVTLGKDILKGLLTLRQLQALHAVDTGERLAL